ncbi:MAG: ankyrin repeat domain-containing protein [Spirochaetota bacterium]|nr:ankyrin repeat domain-containing protein [Spirochaetota bacterium]
MKQRVTYLLLTFFLIITSNLFSQNSSFLEAVIRNNISLVEYMIKHRADVTVTNSDGLTALHLVSDPQIALILIINGADINARNRSGSTPLHWAVSRNKESLAKLLIEFGANIDSADDIGNTPLHFAINSKDELVLLLIRAGANINATNKLGSTPIIEALLKNNNTQSRYLLLAGAKNIKNNAGVTPSILDTLETENSIKDILVSEQVDPVIKEIFIENYPLAIQLIRQNKTINKVDVNGNTALHWAFNKKNRYISKLLLDKKANYTTINFDSQSPLDVLLATEDENFIKYIQEILKNKTNFSKEFFKSKKIK